MGPNLVGIHKQRLKHEWRTTPGLRILIGVLRPSTQSLIRGRIIRTANTGRCTSISTIPFSVFKNYIQGLAHLPLLQIRSSEQSFSVEQEAPKTSLETDMVISISTGTHQHNAQTKSR